MAVFPRLAFYPLNQGVTAPDKPTQALRRKNSGFNVASKMLTGMESGLEKKLVNRENLRKIQAHAQNFSYHCP